MDRKLAALLGFGVLTAGVVIYMTRRRQLTSAGQASLEPSNDSAFRSVLSSAAQPYADIVKQVAQEQSIDPLLLVALVEREDPWWDPNIVSGDGGHGLTQITSDRAWIASADWADPYTNLTRGAQMLGDELSFFLGKFPDDPELGTRYALAAYNRGRTRVWQTAQALGDPDTGTTNNYASGVWNKYQALTTGFLVA